MDVRKKGFYERTSVSDALKILVEAVKPMETEEVRIINSLNRILAVEITAPFDTPPFDRSSVDGYAVRAENTFGASQTNPTYFKMAGSAPVGEVSGIKVNDFEAVKIMTGTPIPKCSDAVVMFEYTLESEGKVEIVNPVSPGKNVSFRGEDVKCGNLLLEIGAAIKPQDIGVMASFGMEKIRVYKKPSAAIICTGNELINPGEKLIEGKIFNSNLYLLSALVSKYNGITGKTYTVKDDYNLIKEKISESLNSNCDLILVTGGTSAGEQDFIPQIIDELGKVLVHGISMRPGMPTGFGVINDKIIFMLPGNPAAVFTAFEFFVIPCLQKMGGMKIHNTHRVISCTLRRKIPSAMGRCDFVRVKVEETNGEYLAEPVRSGGSGLISSLVKTPGFLIVPDNLEGLDAGDNVNVNLY